MTHICVGKLSIIGSDNGLSPGGRQAIIWSNAGILLILPLETNSSEILIQIHKFSFKKNVFENIVWKVAAILSRPQCVNSRGDNMQGIFVVVKIQNLAAFQWISLYGLLSITKYIGLHESFEPKKLTFKPMKDQVFKVKI